MRRLTTLPLAVLALLATAASPGRAEHRRYDPIIRVQELAYDLSYATRDLWHAARYQRHHYDRAERAALEDLYRLHERAERFYREVGRRHLSAHRVRHDFHKLERAWFEVGYQLRALHPYRDVGARLGRVEALMSDLRYAMQPFLASVERRPPRRGPFHRALPWLRFDVGWWR